MIIEEKDLNKQSDEIGLVSTENDTTQEQVLDSVPENVVKEVEKPKSRAGRKKLEEAPVDNDLIIEEFKDDKVTLKMHVVYLKFKKGEKCWVCTFKGMKETNGSIFNKLENKYKFRPSYLQIKNVFVNENLQPLYEFDDVGGYHTEDKLFDNEKDCQEYCNKL